MISHLRNAIQENKIYKLGRVSDEISPETSYEFSGEVSHEAADEIYPSLICVVPNQTRT